LTQYGLGLLTGIKPEQPTQSRDRRPFCSQQAHHKHKGPHQPLEQREVRRAYLPLDSHQGLLHLGYFHVGELRRGAFSLGPFVLFCLRFDPPIGIFCAKESIFFSSLIHFSTLQS
jgi:hypothetical protein